MPPQLLNTLIRINTDELAGYAERSETIGGSVGNAFALAQEMLPLAASYKGLAEDDLIKYISFLAEHMNSLHSINTVRGRFLRQTAETMQNCDTQLANIDRYFGWAGGGRYGR